jgi:RNA polymerase sigma-70 factor (ECF subfamily)
MPDQPQSSSPAPGGDDTRYEAFVRLLVESEPRMLAYLRGLLPTWHDVEEVAQEASLVAWRKFAQFEPGTNFCGWLLTIARFEALKHRRSVARSPLVFSDEVWELLAGTEGDDVEPVTIRREALEVCLGKLPPAQRQLILQAHAPGVKLRQLAAQAGRSEQAFYKTMQRLRSSLLDCITRTLAREEPA